MRKIIVTEYVTLDGVFEDPGGAEKSAHGGWSFQFWNEEAGNTSSMNYSRAMLSSLGE